MWGFCFDGAVGEVWFSSFDEGGEGWALDGVSGGGVDDGVFVFVEWFFWWVECCGGCGFGCVCFWFFGVCLVWFLLRPIVAVVLWWFCGGFCWLRRGVVWFGFGFGADTPGWFTHRSVSVEVQVR